eukprot:518683_1
MAPNTTCTAAMILLLLVVQLNAKRLLQQASCATIRCGLGGPCYDNPFTGTSICCPATIRCDYLSTTPVVCTDGNIYPNECYAYCSKQDPEQCTPHCTFSECVSPITGECSALAPCPNRPYCQTDPFFVDSNSLHLSRFPHIQCKAYPHAECRFSGCGGCYEYFVDSSGAIIQDCDADICSLSSDAGPCEAIMPRYHYDSNTQQCEAFTYGGCEGNANNFETLSDCHATCQAPAVGDSCGVQGQDCLALGAPAALCSDGRTCYLNCGGCVYANDANGNLVCSPEMVSEEVCPPLICGGFGDNCAEYNDGCNACTCFEDGSEACTEKACALDAFTTPTCTRCAPGYLFDPNTNQCDVCFCTLQFDPVCCDGNTQYSNACDAACQQATGCIRGACRAPHVACCDPELKPGNNGNPFCVEGSACCGDGTWSCSIGDGVTFSCGNIIKNPEAFGEECQECGSLQCRDDTGQCITATCLVDPCNDGNNGGCAQGETCSADNCFGPCKAMCTPSISVGCGINHCTSYNDGCNACRCLENGIEACTRRACIELVAARAHCTSCAFGYRLDPNNECVARRGDKTKDMPYVRIN